MTGYFTAPRIAWGPGAVEQLSSLGARRAFVVVDRAVAGNHGHRRVAEELAKSDTTVELFEAATNPDRVDSVAELATRLTSFGPDWIVAVGGGRTLDAAKAARLLFETPGLALSSPPPVLELPDPPRCRLAAIPTTSGSGSEASWTVDLWSSEGDPVELAHRALVPDWAVVDDAFAEGLSVDLRRDGGMEALALATEAYLSAWANPFSDALALSVVRTVFERLPHVLKWSDDPDAKEAMHCAATLSGLAASNAQRGVAHALARALEGPTGLSYAHLLGIVLPYALDFDHPSARDRLETLGATVRRPDETSPLPIAARLRKFNESVRIPSDLRSAGVPPENLEESRAIILARALRAPGVLANPRVPSPAELQTLLTSVMVGAPVR